MKSLYRTKVFGTKAGLSLVVMASATMLVLNGCASHSERPDEEIARAERAIETAEQTGSREFAADALESARENLRRARSAVEAKRYDDAEQWAVKAELDAELATSQTDRAKADQALKEVNDSINTLRDEIARNRNSIGGQ